MLFQKQNGHFSAGRSERSGMLSVVIEKCVESTGGGYLKMDRFKSFECDLSSEGGGSNEVALVCGGEQIGALEDSRVPFR